MCLFHGEDSDCGCDRDSVREEYDAAFERLSAVVERCDRGVCEDCGEECCVYDGYAGDPLCLECLDRAVLSGVKGKSDGALDRIAPF